MRREYLLVGSPILLAFIVIIGCNHNSGEASNNILSMTGSNNTNKPSQATQANTVVIRSEGWEVPGLAQSRITVSRQPIQAGSHQYITILKPTKQFITDNYFSQDEHTTLHLKPNFELNVREITRYDIDGQIFSYKVQVNLVGVTIAEQKKKYTAIPMILALDYYDDNGDGKLESLKWGEVNASPYIPAWIRQ